MTATAARSVAAVEEDQRLSYRLVTGPDDAAFCRRVSDLLDGGYVLHGPPVLVAAGDGVVAAQAVVIGDDEA